MHQVVVRISKETLRQILKHHGITWQATKTWQASNDPEFRPKMQALLELGDHLPADVHAVCVDEFGATEFLTPARTRLVHKHHPTRLRATYRRHGGARHTCGALNLATGTRCYRSRDRKRRQKFLALLRWLRRWYACKLYVVCDNFFPHKSVKSPGAQRATSNWSAPRSMNASWLNWIEAEFADLRYFTLNSSDHPTVTPRNTSSGATSGGSKPRHDPNAIHHRIQNPHPDYLPNTL